MPKFDGVEIIGLPDGYVPKTIVIRDDRKMGIEYGLDAMVYCEKAKPRRIVLEETDEDSESTTMQRLNVDGAHLCIASQKIWKEVKEGE